MLGAIASLGLDMLGGGANAATQFGTAKALSKYNYELGQKSLRNSPSSYKEGLERAGINPILASNSPIGSTQGSSGVNPGMDLADAATKGYNASTARQAAQSQIKLNESQSNSLTSNAKANLMQAQAALKNAETNEKGLTLGYTNTVVNGLNNAAGGTIVPLINGQAHANAVKAAGGAAAGKAAGVAASKAPAAAVVPTPSSAKSTPKAPAAAVPTPSSAKGANKASSFMEYILAPTIGAATTYGAIKLGEKARETIKKDPKSDYNNGHKYRVPNAFGIPSYW